MVERKLVKRSEVARKLGELEYPYNISKEGRLWVAAKIAEELGRDGPRTAILARLAKIRPENGFRCGDDMLKDAKRARLAGLEDLSKAIATEVAIQKMVGKACCINHLTVGAIAEEFSLDMADVMRGAAELARQRIREGNTIPLGLDTLEDLGLDGTEIFEAFIIAGNRPRFIKDLEEARKQGGEEERTKAAEQVVRELNEISAGGVPETYGHLLLAADIARKYKLGGEAAARAAQEGLRNLVELAEDCRKLFELMVQWDPYGKALSYIEAKRETASKALEHAKKFGIPEDNELVVAAETLTR